MKKSTCWFDRAVLRFIFFAISIPVFCFCQSEINPYWMAASSEISHGEYSSDFYRSECTPWTIQIRGSAFFPLKHQLCEIYGTAWPALSLESSYRLTGNLAQDGDQLILWENISWATKTGQSIGFGYYTQLDLIPFTAGIEYELRLVQNLDFYIGAGAAYSLLRIKNYDGFDTTHLQRNSWGFVTKTGLRYVCSTHFYVDVFGDYYYTIFGKMKNDPIQNINNTFSAFFLGAGVGTKF